MDSQEDFKRAYRHRPLLNIVVTGLHIGVFVFGVLAIVALIQGNFVRTLTTALLAVVSFFLWAVLHNWALRHPR